MRLLPFVLKVDGEVVAAFYELSEFLNPVEGTDEKNVIEGAQKLLEQYSKAGYSSESHFPTNPDRSDLIFVSKLDIFPVSLTLSVGANKRFLPVM